ncbi:MAG: TauD/TfdA family dioxygenase [Vulcanimicrobiaceae bacterium]
MQPSTIRILPLSPFGAEVLGVDARHEIDGHLRQCLRDALSEHALLIFRDMDVSKQQLLNYAGIFGTVSDQGEAPGGFNYLSTVIKPGRTPDGDWVLDAGSGELAFHIDHCFEAQPLKAIMLYSIEAPPAGSGGDTLFSDTRIATSMLPEALRRRVATLSVLHRGVKRDPQPESVKPMLWEHPESHVPILFFSHYHAIRIEGLPKDESDALIADLAKYVVVPESIYRHSWQPKELVVWDNLALQHARTDFDPRCRRHMMRVQVAFS